MSDMNYIGSIVKVLETPKQRLINSNTLVVTFRAQLPQMRKIRIVELVCWGNLAKSVINYYKVNDYLLIEGYVSLQNDPTSKNSTKTLKKVKITVLKVYPFLLNYKRFINKLS
jgi:cobalamin biosynthesis Co2+ chelatase CbiK